MYLYYVLLWILECSILLKADKSYENPSNVDLLLTYSVEGHEYLIPSECTTILSNFAQYASDFTKCSIIYARPIKLCERCIDQYLNFRNEYNNLTTTIVDNKSCISLFISNDRLNAVQEYHDNILSIWNKGQCNACYTWSAVPVLSNETNTFNTLFNETRTCIQKYDKDNSSEVCDKCMQNYIQLDNYYKTLSADAIGVDSICMDIVDSMNATRYAWSKTFNCCKIRRTPEIIFLCCAGVISALPLLYYVVLRFFSPIRDFPNVLKQSRFKQTIMGALNRRTN